MASHTWNKSSVISLLFPKDWCSGGYVSTGKTEAPRKVAMPIPVPISKKHIFAHFHPLLYGCFLKWWYPQNTPKWSFLVGKPMVAGYHHFRKPPYNHLPTVLSWFLNETIYYKLGPLSTVGGRNFKQSSNKKTRLPTFGPQNPWKNKKVLGPKCMGHSGITPKRWRIHLGFPWYINRWILGSYPPIPSFPHSPTLSNSGLVRHTRRNTRPGSSMKAE